MADDRDLFGAPVAPAKPNIPKEPTWYVVPSRTAPSTCRGESCGAVVYWVKGYPAPISCDMYGGRHPDSEPDLSDSGSGATVYGDGRGQSHFLNCPDADTFSKSTRGRR